MNVIQGGGDLEDMMRNMGGLGGGMGGMPGMGGMGGMGMPGRSTIIYGDSGDQATAMNVNIVIIQFNLFSLFQTFLMQLPYPLFPHQIH